MRDKMGHERLWTSNLNKRLHQSLLSRLLGTLGKTGINVARSGLRSTLETLAKGCHKMWVTRRAAKRVERSQVMAAGEASDGDSVPLILFWVAEEEIEVSQTSSVDDILTPEQDESLSSNS